MSIIAIDSGNTDLAGAIVYWRLTGDVNGDDMNNALAEVGLEDHKLRLPTPKRAMRRALKELTGGDMFLRAGKQGDTGTYLVKQVPGEDGPEFVVQIEARLGLGEVPVFTPRGEIATDMGMDTEVPAELLARFWHHVFHVAATDISGWLIDQAGVCDALSMRDGGGVYFIPRHALDAWKARVECLHAQTECQAHMVPALNSDDAVAAVTQALLDECAAFTEQLQAEIDAEELGARALETRGNRAQELMNKLGRYELLLGTKLDDIRAQLQEQQTNAIQAALAIDTEEAAS